MAPLFALITNARASTLPMAGLPFHTSVVDPATNKFPALNAVVRIDVPLFPR